LEVSEILPNFAKEALPTRQAVLRSRADVVVSCLLLIQLYDEMLSIRWQNYTFL
jgi:hypothetical protein